MSSTTVAASGAAAVTSTSVPVTAPSPMTARTLRAFARRLPATSSMVVSRWRAAACATCPAGRACRCLGRMTTRSVISSAIWRASELADIAGLLGGVGDGGEVEACAGGDTGRDSALDERGVGEHDPFAVVLGVEVGQQRQGTEYGAAQVRDEQDTVPGVGGGDSGGDAFGTGADPGGLGASGRYHPYAPGDLADEFGCSFGNAVAVGDEHYAYHGLSPVPYCR